MGLTFQQELSSLVNRYSRENASDTPDYILAEYIMTCLKAFDAATRRRDDHKSNPPTPWSEVSGLSKVFGKWPGDETDEEVADALEEES